MHKVGTSMVLRGLVGRERYVGKREKSQGIRPSVILYDLERGLCDGKGRNGSGNMYGIQK